MHKIFPENLQQIVEFAKMYFASTCEFKLINSRIFKFMTAIRNHELNNVLKNFNNVRMKKVIQKLAQKY